MNAQPDLIHIPLAQLQLSPRNTRKTISVGVEDLAASIAAHGLLQNLTVQPAANEGEGFGVVAGGRRLAALQLLAQRGELPTTLASDGIPCRLIHDDDVALEASTAENTLREAMHPADQFDAFHAMIQTGKPIADVAAHFGVAEIVVKQRLKLANVNPQLVQIYREAGMSLEQLQALALTDNHEAQRQAWFTAQHDYERQPHRLRERITQREIESASTLARFVGLDAYEAAGGPVRRDLFDTRGRAWLQDKALLDKLALDKLEVLAQAERDAGWSWAEAHLAMDFAQMAEYPRHPAEREIDFVLTAEQQKRVDEITATVRDLDEDEDTFNETFERLETERDEIHALAQTDASAELKAATGVLVFLSHDGVQIHRARLQPGQKSDKAGTVTGTPKAPAEGKADAKSKKPELSAAVLLNLSAHRSEAIRDQVMGDSQLALALVVDWLIARHRNDFDGSVLCMSGTSVGDPYKVAPDIHDAVREQIKQDLVDLAAAPKKDRLAWLIKLPQTELLRLFAIAVGTRFDGLTERTDGNAVVAALHAATAVNMADHWHAGCDNFLARIPASLVFEAVTEAKGKDVAATLIGLKKDALVAAAAKLLAGTGWLPKPLRGPGYGQQRQREAARDAAPKGKPTTAAPTKAKTPTAKKKPAVKKAPKGKAATKAPARKKARK
jgi:ParB family chromosome partitioning protein